ncbi:DUF397 domain-containing protein [Amycolatopsis sp. CA-128772]|uniref:DUF397 domain-containing protein n=1 Tax=Amycolatopsis sp. CA-128772 TaxID=2073159 RepID=UPI001E4C3A83|nr:DUF397 domain-containing protein [Amycolatopsis sp. CA-128772]
MAEQVGQPSIETDSLNLTWVKSSASSSSGSDACVEVARSAAQVYLRDSKAPEPTLSVTSEAWRAFLDRHHL